MPEHVRKNKLNQKKLVELLLPRHTMLISDQFSEPIINMECYCPKMQCECKDRQKLVFIELKVLELEALLQTERKRQIHEMSCFLAQINIFVPLNNENLDYLSNLASVKTYEKGETILDDADFPLSQFFIVLKGLVYLQKRVTIEKTNFYPVDKENYRRWTKQKVVAHTLGKVEPKQYFGLKESLMNLHAGQLPCSLVIAGEPTTLVFIDKHDLVNVFNSE